MVSTCAPATRNNTTMTTLREEVGLTPTSPASKEKKTIRQFEVKTGAPIIPLPPQRPWYQWLISIPIFVIGPILLPIFILTKGKLKWKGLSELIESVVYATKFPIQAAPYFQNEALIRVVYNQKSSKHYLDNEDALIWQPREGYCGLTTLHCVLASYPGVPRDCLPELIGQPMDPMKFCQTLEETLSSCKKPEGGCDDINGNSNIPIIKGEVIPGNVPYSTFLQNIRRLRNDKERVIVNFHRGVLFGYLDEHQHRWSPLNYMATSLFGHFSPLIGVLEETASEKQHRDESKPEPSLPSNDNPLIAVFDVNHKYGGTYLVPARRLYEAIKAPDVMTGESRGMVVLTSE